MSQDKADSSPDSPKSESGIQQEAEKTTIGGMQACQGENNTQQQTINVNINLETPSYTNAELPDKLKFKSFWNKLGNYIKTLLLILSSLICWFFLGFTVDHAFPATLAKSIFDYLISGFIPLNQSIDSQIDNNLNLIWEKLKSSLDNLPLENSIRPKADKNEETRELNQLDSKYWLLISIVELLSEGINSDDKRLINRKIMELEEERDLILSRLEPLKRQHYKKLYLIQKIWEKLTFKDRRKKDYRTVENILTKLIISHQIQNKPLSREQLQEMLEDLDEKVNENPKVKILYKTWRLMNWIYSYVDHISIEEDPEYQKFPVRGRKTSSRYHLVNGCPSYPRVEIPEDIDRINFFETEEQAKKSGYTICRTCKKILRIK